MIQVNGEDMPLQVETLTGLLESMVVELEGVAVALNGEVVHRDRWPETPLVPGDRVEIVQAVGGG